MARSGSHRRYARRALRHHNPSGGKRHVSPIVWGLGGVAALAVGYGIYKLVKKPAPNFGYSPYPGLGNTTSSPYSGGANAGSLVGGGANSAGFNPPPPSGLGSNAGANNSTLAGRLSSDANARLAFALQAGAYSWYLTEVPPDGIVGTDTRNVIAQIDRASGTSNSTVTRALALLPGAIVVMKGNGERDLQQIPHRLIPLTLPAAIRDQINRDQAAATSSLGGSPPVLQVQAT